MDPPAADGRKIVLSDTDHYSPMKADPLWAWKSFLRGHQPILYDLPIAFGVDPPDKSEGFPSYDSLEAARWALGDTRRLAERIGLISMEPMPQLSSTGYVLADPGREYVVLDPTDGGKPLNLDAESGTYDVEWFSLESREWTPAEPITAGAERTSLRRPSGSGPAVVHLSVR
jgi:hypothetical protein